MKCDCGGKLEPCWFREREYKVVDGHMIATGRTRRACSHLTCNHCGKNHCVDDSLDGPWTHSE